MFFNFLGGLARGPQVRDLPMVFSSHILLCFDEQPLFQESAYTFLFRHLRPYPFSTTFFKSCPLAAGHQVEVLF